jgi:hypothetical protein
MLSLDEKYVETGLRPVSTLSGKEEYPYTTIIFTGSQLMIFFWK